MPRKVEFIESYIKVGNDYQWNDNHGELIRCKDCKHRIMFPSENVYKCLYSDFIVPEHYCGYAERKKTA